MQNDMNKNPRKRGGQPGNTNARKHGGYTTVRLEVLNDEERDMISDIDTDEEYQLEEQLILYTIRERRILQYIKSVKATAVKGKVEIGSNIGAMSEKDEGTSQKKMKPRYTTSFLERQELAVLRLERELTSIQRNKTRVINSLAELRRYKDNSSDDWLDAFFSAVSETDDL